MTNYPKTSTEHLLSHAGWVQGLARELIFDPNRADDAIQQTWLAALKNPPKNIENPKGWLRRVLKNAHWEAGRSEARRGKRETAAARGEAIPGAAEIVERTEMQRHVVEKVLSLKEPYRSTLLFRFFDDLTPMEIAQKTGDSDSTVRTRLRRGLELMREKLDRETGDRRAWAIGLIPLALPRKTALAAGSTGVLGVVASLGIKAKIAALLLIAGAGGWSLSLALSPQEEQQPNAPEPMATAAPLPVENSDDQARKTNRFPIEIEEKTVRTRGDSVQPVEIHVLHSDGTPAYQAWVDLEDSPTNRIVKSSNQPGVVGVSGKVSSDSKSWGKTKGRTDETGILKLSQVPVDGSINIREASYYSVRFPVSPKNGKQTLQLKGSMIKGRVWVNGKPPTRMFSLYLYTAIDQKSGKSQDPRPGMGDGFSMATGEFPINIPVDSQGNFAISGLPKKWKGSLECNQSYRFRDGRGIMELDGPAKDLLLDLEYPPGISGRAWLPGEQKPAAEISYAYVFKRKGGSSSGGHITDAEGRFHIPLSEQNFYRFNLMLHDKSSGFMKTVERKGIPKEGLDLGEIILEPGKELRFSVKDRAGKPIAGALARWSDHIFRATSTRTDEEGRGVFQVPPVSRGTVTIAALGYEPATVSKVEGQELEVALKKTNSLRIHVPQGRKFQVRIRSQFNPLASSVNRMVNPNMVQRSMYADHRSHQLIFQPTGKGIVHLTHLLPDLPLDIEMIDRTGSVIESAKLSLASQEERELHFETIAEEKSLLGVVVNSHGQPIPGARVQIRKDIGYETPTYTDQDGQFSISGISSDTLNFRIKRKGYADRMLDNFPIPTQGKAKIVLDEGNEFKVLVLKSNDEILMDLVSMQAYDAKNKNAWKMTAGKSEDGAYRFKNTPSRRLKIRAIVGGRSFVIDHDPQKKEEIIRIPDFGSAEIHWDIAWDLPENSPRLVLVVTPDKGTEDPVQIQWNTLGAVWKGFDFNNDRDPGQASFPVLFPGSYKAYFLDNEKGDIQSRIVRFEIEAGQTTRMELTR